MQSVIKDDVIKSFSVLGIQCFFVSWYDTRQQLWFGFASKEDYGRIERKSLFDERCEGFFVGPDLFWYP